MNPLEIVESSLNFPDLIWHCSLLGFSIFVLSLFRQWKGGLNVVGDVREPEDGIGLFFGELSDFDVESFKEGVYSFAIFSFFYKWLDFFVQWGVIGFLHNNVRILVVLAWNVDWLLDILSVIIVLTIVLIEGHFRFIFHTSDESFVIRWFLLFFLFLILIVKIPFLGFLCLWLDFLFIFAFNLLLFLRFGCTC